MNQRLEADSIWLEYSGHKILQNIYLKMETGKITGLLGRNGTGKSSLLKIVFGTLRGQSQSVRVNGVYCSHPYQMKNLIRYLPQNHFLPDGMTLAKASTYFDISEATILHYFPHLEECRNVPTKQLSGGNRRLVEVLLILLSPVSFILLDEPFSHLSPLMVEKLQEVIIEQKKSRAILLSDHVYQSVLDLADEVYLMVPVGRLILLSCPQEELKNYGYIR